MIEWFDDLALGPRLSDYRGIASFNAVLAPIAPFSTWSRRHSIARRHIHLGGGWIGQEIIHRQWRNIWRNWGTHCFWHWRDPVMDFSGSDLVFKSTPSYSPRRELTSSIPRSRRRVGPLPLADTSLETADY